MSSGVQICKISLCAGNELFLSHREYGLEALVAEIYETGEPASYFGVGVVKKAACESGAYSGRDKESLQVNGVQA